MAIIDLINVLLVDDHLISVLGTKALLSETKEINIVGVANNSHEAMDMISKKKIDVVLLDLYLPQINGFEILKLIKDFDNEIKVILLTVSEEKEKIFTAITLNVDGYIFKDTSNLELTEAIIKVHSGKRAFDARVMDYIFDDVKRMINSEYYGIDVLEVSEISKLLTQREIEILKMIGEKKSSKQIAEIMGITKNTVSTYRRNIGTKLKINKPKDMALLAHKLVIETI